MLISCPECAGQVSTKAFSCPHCGYPMKKTKYNRRKSHARLPNGFGSITEVKGRNLRRPFLARYCAGKTDTGRPILKTLKPTGYFKTYNEAYSALMEYNANPYSLDTDLTVSEVYKRFKKAFDAEGHTRSYKNHMEVAYERSSSVHDMSFRSIRPRHIKACVEGLDISANSRNDFKIFWNRMFDYAIEYELADHNYARDFDFKDTKKVKRAHLSFTDDEMRVLWQNSGNELVGMILIQCYTGFRPDEICTMKTEQVNLDSWYMKGGSKTEAGMDRVVPIHTAVRPLVKSYYAAAEENDRTNLFTIYGHAMTYGSYHHALEKLVKDLGLNPGHRPHDPRKQFVTMAKKAGMDDYAIKKLVGHKISDVTEAKYTDRDLEWLRSDLEKIKVDMYK